MPMVTSSIPSKILANAKLPTLLLKEANLPKTLFTVLKWQPKLPQNFAKFCLTSV